MAIVDRNTLYEQIWTVPAMQLALRYGISDVGLAKVCRRHRIPRPPRGYWAKIRSGQRVRRPSLPKVDESLQEVYINGANMPFNNSDETSLSSKSSRERILVPAKLISPHSLVEAAYQQLTSATPGQDKMVKTNPVTAADIRVQPEMVDRALRVFDTFAKTWEQEGGQIVLGEINGNPCTAVAIGEDAVSIHMTETTQPLRRGRRSVGVSAPFSRLCFIIGEGKIEGIKTLWADTTTIRLEKMIRPLIDALRRYLDAQQIIRLDRECKQRQRTKAHVVRQAKADKHSEEFNLRQQLLQDADRWHQAEKIRSYLEALEKRIESGEIRPSDPESFNRWLEWAKWFADDMDPMVQTSSRQQELIAAQNTPVADLDLTSQARDFVTLFKIKDSDELLLVPEDEVREATGWNSEVWRELTRVLEGLGYDVANRKRLFY